MKKYTIKNFNKGTIDTIEDYSIPEEAASRSLNWLTRGDKIELSGGYLMVDSENAIAGSGRVSGLHMGEKVDGTIQPFYTYGTKLLYLDGNGNWQEVGSDLLGTQADGEDISFTNYVSLAGYQTWMSSPNSSLYKIMNANPASYRDMYDASKNFKGYIDAQNSRLHLWNRDRAKNYLYGSYKDVQNTTTYTSVSAEAVGSSGSTNYTGTLSEATGKRTVFNTVFTDGTQTMQDNGNGEMVGDGTGTINYVTGAYDVTFTSTTTGSVTTDYQYEDSTVHGLADFTFSSTRIATEGYFLPQNTGGNLLNVLPYTTDFYCIHEKNAYIFSMPVDDLNPTNQIWRNKVSMQNWRAAVATGEGIYYIDTGDKTRPTFNLLTLSQYNNEVVPTTKSFNLNLAGIDFSKGMAIENGEFIFFTGSSDGVNNDRVFAYNRTWNTFDTLKYYTSCFANNDDVLWAGDSISNNVYKLFTGYTADGGNIENYWEGKLTRLEIEELKKSKRLTIEGDIATSQELEIYASFDRGSYVKLGTIEGNGSYVDSSFGITVGSNQIARKELGGGSEGELAYHYRYEIRIQTKKFDEIKLKFVAKSVGYVSVSTIDFYDVKLYGQKNLKRYRKTITNPGLTWNQVTTTWDNTHNNWDNI